MKITRGLLKFILVGFFVFGLSGGARAEDICGDGLKLYDVITPLSGSALGWQFAFCIEELEYKYNKSIWQRIKHNFKDRFIEEQYPYTAIVPSSDEFRVQVVAKDPTGHRSLLDAKGHFTVANPIPEFQIEFAFVFNGQILVRNVTAMSVYVPAIRARKLRPDRFTTLYSITGEDVDTLISSKRRESSLLTVRALEGNDSLRGFGAESRRRANGDLVFDLSDVADFKSYQAGTLSLNAVGPFGWAVEPSTASRDRYNIEFLDYETSKAFSQKPSSCEGHLR